MTGSPMENRCSAPPYLRSVDSPIDTVMTDLAPLTTCCAALDRPAKDPSMATSPRRWAHVHIFWTTTFLRHSRVFTNDASRSEFDQGADAAPVRFDHGTIRCDAGARCRRRRTTTRRVAANAQESSRARATRLQRRKIHCVP